ncbi:MAG: CoB--CoM heterodisulfide reductase iron-sulfur subunit A family protein [Planctomycetes bacterium]|nr:CoB--CoM heterodisulfide reductase iron-sulfur subunit A family protein [Planctomycetota bacterium]
MRIGVYVCHCGGNISEVVEVQEVAEFTRKQPDVVLVRDFHHMCSDLGQQLILDDIAKEKLDRIVVAACSPQFQGSTFMRTAESAGMNPYLIEMANIREHCSWPHFDFPEDATVKAKYLTNISITKARLDEPLEKKSLPLGKRVLVIGAGIAGIQASLDLADAGFEVYLVEKEPSIGGKMAKLSRTFPTEDCSACILSPKMADVGNHPNINLYTYSEVKDISGFLGNFEVTVTKKPRYVDKNKCVACGECEEKCPVKVPDEFEEGLTTRKAIYIPFNFAVPYKNLIDDKVCLRLTKGGETCGLCQKVCAAEAINFNDQAEEIKFTVDTIIVATGYDTYDAREKKVYGYGKYKNVITALEMERFLAHAAEGEALRDLGKRIAFIQCVGSRDEQIGREYCSRVCCMYAAKLAQLLKRSDPKKDIYIFYTDMRTYGKGFEEYYKRAQREGVKFIRGRPAELMENPETQKVILKTEDTLTRQLIETEFDTVVLSVGMQPNSGAEQIASQLRLARGTDGFFQEAHPKFKPVDTLSDGIFLAGTAQGPKDIPDSVAQGSAAAARAMALMNPGEYVTEPFVSAVNEDLCAGCGLCVALCPYDALELVEKDGKKISQVNVSLCKCCGSCVATCPAGAMEQKGFLTAQMISMVETALE